MRKPKIEDIKPGKYFLCYQDRVTGIVPSSHLIEPIRQAQVKGFELKFLDEGQHIRIGYLSAEYVCA